MRQILAVIFAILASTNALATPAYNAQNPPPSLGTGNPVNVWVNETPTPGTGTTAASQQLVLNSSGQKNGTPFSVTGKFSGAPGAFEVDIQLAATDSDTNYQTCASCNVTTVDATNNTFRLDFWGGNASFVRLLMRTRTNSVSITAQVTGG